MSGRGSKRDRGHLGRQHEPWLFVEFVAIAAWLAAGDPIAAIAFRLKRRVTQVRAVAFGDPA